MPTEFVVVVSKRYRGLQSLSKEPRATPSWSTIDRAVTDLPGITCVEPTDVGGSRFRPSSMVTHVAVALGRALTGEQPLPVVDK